MRLSLETLRDFENTWGEEFGFCVDVLSFEAQRKHHRSLDFIAVPIETAHVCKVLLLSLMCATAYIQVLDALKKRACISSRTSQQKKSQSKALQTNLRKITDFELANWIKLRDLHHSSPKQP